jgi:hypothetical protein
VRVFSVLLGIFLSAILLQSSVQAQSALASSLLSKKGKNGIWELAGTYNPLFTTCDMQGGADFSVKLSIQRVGEGTIPIIMDQVEIKVVEAEGAMAPLLNLSGKGDRTVFDGAIGINAGNVGDGDLQLFNASGLSEDQNLYSYGLIYAVGEECSIMLDNAYLSFVGQIPGCAACKRSCKRRGGTGKACKKRCENKKKC